MPLTENKNWLMAFMANQPGHATSGSPLRGGVASDVMDADIAALEKLLFLYVRRWAGCVVYMALAPFGWGYLRSRAADADAMTYRPPMRVEPEVVPLKAKAVLRLVRDA